MRLQRPSAAGSQVFGRRSKPLNRVLWCARQRVHAATVEQNAPAAELAAVDLPAALRNACAVLKAPESTVYVLGVSHVSAVACDQVKDLVAAVKPEVVVVELCKDRTGLLVDDEATPKVPDTWICTRVEIPGLPGSSDKKEDDEEKEKDDKRRERDALDEAAAKAAWPRAADLAPLLRTRIGRAVTTSDVEGDVAALEATGLFSKVRPLCESGRRGDAPLFGAMKAEGGGGLELEYVAPLGCTRFLVEPRELPAIKSMAVRLDSSVKASGVSQAELDEVAAEAVASCSADPPRPALLAYLVARQRLISLVEAHEREHNQQQQAGDAADSSSSSSSSGGGAAAEHQIVVDFTGVADGVAEAVVRARRPGDGDAAFVSGLEASADGGAGAGIDKFRPARRGVQLSPRMSLPAEAAARMNALKAARRAEAAKTAHEAGGRSYPFRFWDPEEVAPADLTGPEPNVGQDALAGLLTSSYAALQARAGRAAGVPPGAAWRAAMLAATEHGAVQFVLGDRTAQVSQRRLAAAMFSETVARLAGAVAAIAAAAVAAGSPAAADLLAGALPGAEAGVGAVAVAAGAAAAAALLWPVMGPLVEVWQFSQLDGPAVEEAVAVKEPIQANLDQPLYFWGEDALLRWPGATGPLIDERDAYMARVAAAVATGAPTGAPAFVADEADGQLVWRYAMPQGGPEGSAPKGLGEGEYLPPRGGARSVVVVVGTAHVRGMCRLWEEALAKAGDVREFVAEAEWKPAAEGDEKKA